MLYRYSSLPWTLLFPSVQSRGVGSGVHLTFDDGPHPIGTPKLLEILRIASAPSTFFVTGLQALKYPDLLRAIVAEGHAVGSHGFSHSWMVCRSTRKLAEEIERADIAISEVIGVRPQLLRPPFGAIGPTLMRQAARLQKRLILWSLDLRDFQSKGRQSRLKRVVEETSSGEILLLHNSELTAQEVDTYLPDLIRLLKNKGMTFSSISQ